MNNEYISNLNLTITYYIGKNANDNFKIIDEANINDIWFHIKDYPSCHVIASISNQNIDRKNMKYIIKRGALLCKQKSKYANIKNLEIIYTEIKNVSKTSTIGSVTTVNTKTITI
jgi:predicted ribosome quality control (RQC) complex YloA/Tae2 family protein